MHKKVKMNEIEDNKEHIQHVNIHFDEEDVEEEKEKKTEIKYVIEDAPQLTLATEMKEKPLRQRKAILLTSHKGSFIRSLHSLHERHQFEVDTTIAVLLFLFDVYKIFMGSFLTIFTYQSCDIINEKFGCFMSPFQVYCLIFNCITFVSCFILLGFQIHRESYFIRELYAFKNSNESIEHYFQTSEKMSRQDIYGRDILEQVGWFNNKYSFCVKANIILFLLNIVFSGIGIYTYSYIGSKTATSFISNVLLLGLLLGNSAYVVYTVEKSEVILACSAYKQDFVRYNGANIWTRWRVEKGHLAPRKSDVHEEPNI